MKTIWILLFVLFSKQSISQTSAKQPLKIGDRCPDISFAQVINHSKSELKLSNFKGKAVLIDFWAPWCTPCLTIFPKLDSLQQKFKEQLVILPVTVEEKGYAEITLQNLKKKTGITLTTSAVEDKVASKLFNHRVIPHYIWIDREGVIKAITGSDEITESNIKLFVDNDQLMLTEKKDEQNFDDSKPFFATGQTDIRETIFFYSTLTKYTQKVFGGAIRRDNWINISNAPIVMLYKLGLGRFNLDIQDNNRLILEGFETLEDSLLIGRWTSTSSLLWKKIEKDNLYCYEIVVPDLTYTNKELFDFMCQDLDRYFARNGISGRKEARTVKLLSLVRTSDIDKLESKGGAQKNQRTTDYISLQNMPIWYLMANMQGFFRKEGSTPMRNKTGYLKNIDIEIRGNLGNIDEINKQLEKYDLKLIEEQDQLDMIIITKKSK